MKNKFALIIPVITLLFVAFAYPLPYGAYTLNRIVVTLYSVFIAVSIWEKKQYVSHVFIFIGILFNPFIPIHLTREIWKILDIVASVPFALLILIKI